jgi:curved DNA-binding protein CbpA
MARQLTWYDVLDVLPGSSADQVQRAFELKESLLRPTLISGAPSKVVSAAERARTAIKAARDVLTDPASRRDYDDEIGIRQTGGGLSGPDRVPSEDGSIPDFVWYGRSAMVAAAALEAFDEWLAPPSAPPRRIALPDIRGLFVGPCRRLLSGTGLRIEVVRLTRDPMPVEGLIVDQSPPPGARSPRSRTVTVQVWHPAQPRASGHDDRAAFP